MRERARRKEIVPSERSVRVNIGGIGRLTYSPVGCSYLPEVGVSSWTIVSDMMMVDICLVMCVM